MTFFLPKPPKKCQNDFNYAKWPEGRGLCHNCYNSMNIKEKRARGEMKPNKRRKNTSIDTDKVVEKQSGDTKPFLDVELKK